MVLIRLLYTLDSILKFHSFHLVPSRSLLFHPGNCHLPLRRSCNILELIRNLPKTYLEHIRNPFGTSICFYLSQHITTHSDILRHIQTHSDTFGHIRTHSDILEHLGTSWNILERLGTSWNVLERLRTS